MKFIIVCTNNDIHKIEAESKEKIKKLLDPILEKIVNEGYFEKGDSTNFIHEYYFYINNKEVDASDFICYNWYNKEAWFQYKILSLDEWYDQNKIILENDLDED